MIYGILDENFQFKRWDSYDVLPRHKTGRVRPQVIDPVPSYNPLTHRYTQGNPIVTPTSVRATWVVVALTQQERDDIASHDKVTQVVEGIRALENAVATTGNLIETVNIINQIRLSLIYLGKDFYNYYLTQKLLPPS